MNIDAVRTFLKIVELGGFTQASRRLHRSQPAISRRLTLLEQELGAPLFDRIRSRATLTEAGRAFLPHAETALAALDDGRESVRSLQHGARGNVTLALVGTLADTQIVSSLRQFARRSPDVHLELRTASSAEVSNLVRRGEAMLGLRYHANDRPDLVGHPAGEEEMLVVAEAGHRLAGRRVREAAQLAGERWIGFPPMAGDRRGTRDVLARQLMRAGLDDAEVTHIDSLTAQKRLAEAGFGLALVPESSVRDELRRGVLVCLDVPFMRTTNQITAIHRRNGYLSPAASTLLDLLTRSARPQATRPAAGVGRAAEPARRSTGTPRPRSARTPR